MEAPRRDDVIIWIIRNQFGRRNITLASRCELAEKLAEALKPKAKENQKARKGKQRGADNSGNIAKDDAINTRAQSAKEAGVSDGSLKAFRYLKDNAEPEELAELKRNPNAKLHKVVKTVKERKQKAGGAKSNGDGKVVHQKPDKPLDTKEELARAAVSLTTRSTRRLAVKISPLPATLARDSPTRWTSGRIDPRRARMRAIGMT